MTYITHRPPTARARRSARTRDIAKSVDAVRRIMRVLRVAEQRTQQETGISAAQVLVLQQLGDFTPTGRALLRRAAQSPAAILVAGLRGLTPHQLTDVGRCLNKLSRALGADNGSA